MNKYYISIVAGIIAAAFSSCTDWLDVKPEKNTINETYWMTDKDATDALNACYWDLRAEGLFGRDLFWEQAGGGDDLIYGRSRGADQNNLANFTYSGTESSLKSTWDLFNKMIARSNSVVYNLSKKANTDIQKIRLGEAYFMRAFAHFWIAYRYGKADQGVPFIRYEDYDPYYYETIPPQQASVMENYKLIIEDLEKAANLLPYFEDYDNTDWGRAHKAAAWGLMVKVYAYWAQYDESKWDLIPPLVNKLESDGKRGLLNDFADVFKTSNEWSEEYIWSVNSSGASGSDGSIGPMAGSLFTGVCLENKGWGRYNGWGYFKPTLGLFDEYAQGDKRRDVTILAYGDEFIFFGEKRKYYSTSDLEAGFQLAKYMEPFTGGTVENGIGVSDRVSPNGDRPTTDLNLPLIRHAEMVLFKAEALIMKGKGTEAAKELNRLTQRAGLGEIYTNATMADLKHERRCELAGEFTDRFMDLKRWKDWNKLNAPKTGRHHYLLDENGNPVYKDGNKVGDRGNPAAPWEPIEVWPARSFDPSKNTVYPYNPDEITRSKGTLNQNPGY